MTSCVPGRVRRAVQPDQPAATVVVDAVATVRPRGELDLSADRRPRGDVAGAVHREAVRGEKRFDGDVELAGDIDRVIALLERVGAAARAGCLATGVGVVAGVRLGCRRRRRVGVDELGARRDAGDAAGAGKFE